MKLLIFMLITLIFSACNFGDTPKEIEAKLAQSKEIQLKKIDAKTELEKQKALLQDKKDKALLNMQMLQMQHDNNTQIERYILIMSFFLLIIVSFFIYYYLKKRHEDKLRAYKDNLEKYFHQQENMTRMRIAEKIIDTVASGKLDKAQEMELIKALSGNIESPQETKLLDNNTQEIIIK